ncbi:hypothetical protein ES705_39172 [subsurface metagenome]
MYAAWDKEDIKKISSYGTEDCKLIFYNPDGTINHQAIGEKQGMRELKEEFDFMPDRRSKITNMVIEVLNHKAIATVDIISNITTKEGKALILIYSGILKFRKEDKWKIYRYEEQWENK